MLQWARDMIAAGNVHEDARAETGETFHLRFGSGKIGMMGTGNFNITLAKEQNPEMDFGIALLPGVESGQVASFAGGDIVTIPKGSKRVDDAVDFMKWLLSDEVQVEGYARDAEHDHARRHGGQQVLRGEPEGAGRRQGDRRWRRRPTR